MPNKIFPCRILCVFHFDCPRLIVDKHVRLHFDTHFSMKTTFCVIRDFFLCEKKNVLYITMEKLCDDIIRIENQQNYFCFCFLPFSLSLFLYKSSFVRIYIAKWSQWNCFAHLHHRIFARWIMFATSTSIALAVIHEKKKQRKKEFYIRTTEWSW